MAAIVDVRSFIDSDTHIRSSSEAPARTQHLSADTDLPISVSSDDKDNRHDRGQRPASNAQPSGQIEQLEQAQDVQSAPASSHLAVQQANRPVPIAQPHHVQWHPPYTAFQYGPPVPPGPAIFYPPYHGMPILMNQCPRCLLRAGEPFMPAPIPAAQPVPQPRPSWNRDSPHIPEQNRRSQTQQQPSASQAPLSPSGPNHHSASLSHHEYPIGHPNHPNAHLFVAPDGQTPYADRPRAAPTTFTPAEKLPTRYAEEKLEAYRKAQSEAQNTGKLPTMDIALKRDLHNLEHPDQYLVKMPDGSTRIRKRKHVPSRIYKRRLTRDERRDILLMRKLQFKYEDIAEFLGTTLSAVSYTIKQNTAEPGHKNSGRKGGKPDWPEALIDQLVAFVKEHREKEKVGGFDTARNQKKVPSLTYNMIRESVFADEHSNIPEQYKKFTTDDAIKAQLNKYGLWLRQPMPPHLVERARARGKKQWLDKLERGRQEAEDAADVAGDTPAAPDGAGPSVVHGYAEVDVDDEDMDDMDIASDGQMPDDAEDAEAA